MRTKYLVLSLAVFCLIPLVGRPALGQFAGLVPHIPGDANTIILLNVEKILDSELAKKEGWKENFDKAVEAGLVRLPTDTQQYILASRTDFSEMQPIWEAGVLKTSKPHSVATAAEKRKATQDNISGQDVIMLADGTYIVQFDARTYGALMPASRQAVARWIRTSTSESLSQYMKEAIGYSEKVGTEIIMAIDMANVLEPGRINERLKEFESISKEKIDLEKVSQALLALRGVTLGITLGEKPFGKIKMDFSEDVLVLEKIAGPLFMEVLKRNNAMIADFEQWTSKTNGNQVTFEGYFSANGMRKIFSLIEAPVSDAVVEADPSEGQKPGDATGEDVAYSTQKYFHSVTRLMDEFRNHDSPQRLSQFGIWLDKYARRIDKLPIVNVDKDMLDFGQYVAQQYRNAATAIKGIGVRSRVRVVNANNNMGPGGHSYYGNNYYNGGYAYNGYYYRGGYGGRYGPGGGYAGYYNAGLQSQQRAQTQIRSQEKARGASAARSIMQELTNARQEVRRTMTEKYKIEF